MEVLKYRASSGKFWEFQSKIELLQDSISFRGKIYPYSSVVHLGRYARKTSFNFIPVEDFLRLRIYVVGLEKPITLKNSLGLIFTTSTLKKIHQRLIEKTFQLRAKRYFMQIESMGYFEYGGARFCPAAEVLIKDKKINLRTAKVWLEPFEFVLKESAGFFARTRRVNTEIDQDVFLMLLKEIYGISFGD